MKKTEDYQKDLLKLLERTKDIPIGEEGLILYTIAEILIEILDELRERK